MKLNKSSVVIGLASIMMVNVAAGSQTVGFPKIGATSIGGTVTSSEGPEAGVWVIAEASESATQFVKIVVTDDRGRFVVPDLPTGKYEVWARGYGLIDSQPTEASPGKLIRLEANKASSPHEAAKVYPGNYWFSLIQVPAENEFPGTGPRGNGIAPSMTTQQHWIAHMAENCQLCHQQGYEATRVLPDIGDPVQAWEQRISKDRGPDDPFFLDDKTHHKRQYGMRMNNVMTLFGRERGLNMFADWTTRIAKGELPSVPPRPTGFERNVVLTLRGMGDGRFVHDSSSTDKRRPTINAGGPIYGYGTYSGMVMVLDPKTGKEEQFNLTNRDGGHFKNSQPHTGAMDGKGRVWMTNITHLGGFGGPILDREGATFCADPDHKFAKYFPRTAEFGKPWLASVFDPRTKKDDFVPLCFGTHHLDFDKDERLYFSGDTEVVGWLDVDVWDETKDPEKAVGWCPYVLDTNGDGRITPDRKQWNLQLEGIEGGVGANIKAAAVTGSLDPKKDTRIAGLIYGLGVSPKDQSLWGAKFSPYVPSGLLRVEAGANPPETCKTEYYEPPKSDGRYSAYNARGVDLDTHGVAWVAFGSGALGKFDRSKCKVLNGPTATGQHCPEGWEIIETPGPKFKNTHIGSDWFYEIFVDQHDTFGLGKDVPILANSVGDELLAYLPEKREFVHLRVPYPRGFYPRLLDGRIDDPKAGWKGRGLWATNNLIPLWHQETGEGSTAYAVHFQLRPTPLAE